MYQLLNVVLWSFAMLLEGACALLGLVLVVVPAFLVGAVSYGPALAKTANMWGALQGWPGGGYMFSKLVGLVAPYTASVSALVTHVEPGVCEASMTDRPWKRNPFASVHAIAIANLAEMTAGIACVTATQSAKGAMGIPVGMRIEFVAKARGTLHCRASVPDSLPSAERPDEKDIDVVCDVSDATGKVVAAVVVAWKFRMKKSRKPKAS